MAAPIYEKYMGSVMSALKGADIKTLQGIYDNFMRHPSSVGLHGMPADMQKFYRALKPVGYFYHVNHTRECLVKADDFGIDKENFVLLHKIPALWNAARNLLMDENEYLY
jgi:hypothetical protein